MDIFSKRPLFLSCMIFLACSVIGYFISGVTKLIIIALAALVLVFSLILALIRHYSADKKYSFLCFILVVIMILLSFIGSYVNFNRKLEKRIATYGNQYTVNAFVTDIQSQSNFASEYMIYVINIDGREDSHLAILSCGFAAALQPGDKISITATAGAIESNGGKYDAMLEHYSNNIYVTYTSENPNSLTVQEYSTYENTFSFDGVNYKLSNILVRNVGGDAGDLSSSLLLGNKHLLASTVKRDFRRAGASHILALSGMHMSIIMGAAMFIMKRITQKSWLIAIILSAFALTYLAVTGFSVSATRSVIMLLIVYLSMLISALPDPLTSLSIAGFIIVLFSPGTVLDAAFWMSFSATLGILVFVPPINEYFNQKASKYDNGFKKIIHKVLYSLIVAFATGVAALIPLIAVMCIFIKELSVFSVISSLVLSIPTAIIIIGALLLLIFQGVPFVSDAIIYILRLMSDFMIDFCGDVSQLDGIVLSLNYPFAAFMAIALVIALLYSFASKHKNPFTALIPFAICLTLCIGAMTVYEKVNSDTLKVSYINASSNSDMLVLSNEREAVICDISNGSKSSYFLALDEIYQSRVTEIKAVMLTRYTNQHNATLQMLCESNRVREFWLPTPENEDDLDKLLRIYAFSEKNGIDVYLYDKEESLYALGNVTIEHTYDYIDRSTVPICLVGVYTGREHLTYISPAFNESDIHQLAQYHFSKSQYIIFGNRGPKTKREYTVENIDKVSSIAFADDMRAAYFIPPEFSFTAYYTVPEEIEYYLDK